MDGQYTSLSSTEPAKAIQEIAKVKGPTIDIQDVSRFSQLSESWWNTSGKMKLLHSLNPLRVQFIRDGLANTGRKETNPHLPLEGVSIVEIGCGGGILSEPIARIGANMTGIDPSGELIECARKHASLDPSLSKRLNYIQTSVEDLRGSNMKAYDAVVASEVLEHVADQDIFLKHCTALLKPGGSIFLTTINKTLSSWLVAIITAEYILKVIPRGTHEWNKFISPSETSRLLDKYNCRTNLVHGMMYNPIKNEWHWSSNTAISYAIHAVKKEE